MKDIQDRDLVLSYKSASKRLNDLTFTDYYYRLMMLARTIFEWSGLPNGIDEKHIEKWLYQDGRVLFFKDKTKGLMCLRCTDSGQLNPYDEPTRLTPYATGYMGDSLENGEDCILIRNNDDMIPTKFTIQLFAMRLTNLERAIDVNVNAQKTPIMIYCSDKQKLSLKNVYSQWNENEPVIFGDKMLQQTPITAIKTDAPIVFDKLQIQKHSVWNEIMTFLGINNANMDKRERLVDDEVQANNEQVDLSVQIMLKAREEACKRINELFGTNISVKLRKLDMADIEVLRDSEDDSRKEDVVNG